MEKIENRLRTFINVLAYGTLLLFASCKPGFESIDYGDEACAHCKMTIVDPQYAAELITSKGKVFKFDDVVCMRQYVQDHTDLVKEAKLFVANYNSDKGEFIDANSAVYLKHDFFASPMNGNAAAFNTESDAKYMKDSLGVAPVTWNNL